MQTVLIVDDDPFIRRLIATTLEDVAASYELLQANDGREALDLAAERPPALVFLDIDMPGLDGLEACRRLREDPGTAEATIVILTAASGGEMERAAEEAGADLFLTKPFSPLELLRLVDALDGAR